MFGSKNPQDTRRPAGNSRDHGVTILTSGCSFSGKLYCRGASRIGGRIEGEIISENSLVIEEGAEIIANIQAEEAIVQGFVKGKIRATKRVELCANARFDGDIMCPSLIIREGAQFNGTSEMISALESIESKTTKQQQRSPAIIKEIKKQDQGGKAPAVDSIAVKSGMSGSRSEPEVTVAQ